MRWIDRIPQIPVTLEQMSEASRAVAEAAERIKAEGGDPDFRCSTLALVQGVPKKWSREACAAILFRMQALNELLKGGELAALAMPCETEGEGWLITDNILEATARAQLKIGEGATFNPVEFRRIALEASDTEGRG